MIKRSLVFGVSILAILVAGVANANIASQGYVDQEVGTKLSSITGSTSGVGNVVTNVTASGGTITATRGITAEVATNKVTTIRDAETATDGSYPSEKAVATALAGKADSADLANLATKDEVALKADKTALNAYAKTEDLATVATTGSYDDLTNKPNIPEGVVVDEALTAEGTNPVQGKAIYNALAGKQDAGDYATNTALNAVKSTAESAQEDATQALSDAASAKSAADSKVAKAQGSAAANKVLITDGSGNVTTGTVSSAMITDGTISNADISTSAAIAQSKISGLTDDLAAKADKTELNSYALKSSLSTVATTGSYNDLKDKPTIPEGVEVDSFLTQYGTNPVQGRVIYQELQEKLDKTGTAARATADANGNNIASTYATKNQLSGYVTTSTLNGLDSTSSGSGAVVTEVSQTNGKVTVTKGNVKIPVGSESATSYATIWIE